MQYVVLRGNNAVHTNVVRMLAKGMNAREIVSRPEKVKHPCAAYCAKNQTTVVVTTVLSMLGKGMNACDSVSCSTSLCSMSYREVNPL